VKNLTGRDWRPVLLLIGSASGVLLAFAMILALLAYAVSGSALGRARPVNEPDVLQAMVLVGSVALVGALSLPAFYYTMASLRGRALGAGGSRSPGTWQIFILIVAWLGACWLGQAVIGDRIWKWAAPALHALAIGAPVYLWGRLAAGGLSTGSPVRSWGLLVAGMWFSTGLAMFVEVALAVLGLAAVGVYMILNPGQLLRLQQFSHALSGVASLSDALTVLQPWLDRPIVFLAALVVFAGVTPIIEEAAKSVAIWGIVDRLGEPADGFVAGALIGAGFGLVEGLLASVSPDPFWAVTLAVRGGSSVMHIAAASFAGYGIVAFRRTRRLASLPGGYVAAILIHGLWNASVVIMGFGGLHISTGLTDSNWIGLFLVVFGASILAALCAATPIALMAINRRLRPMAALSQPVPALEPAMVAPPTGTPTGPEH